MLPDRKHHRLSASIYTRSEYEFFFTVCARGQGQPFKNRALAKAVVDSLLWTKRRYDWLLFCYCLMPDHLHFICRLKEDAPPARPMGARGEVSVGVLDHVARFKSFTTNTAWKLGVRGTLWQKSSFDRVIDMEHPFLEIAEYVLNNPVRKELVKSWEEWPDSKIVDPWW